MPIGVRARTVQLTGTVRWPGLSFARWNRSGRKPSNGPPNFAGDFIVQSEVPTQRPLILAWAGMPITTRILRRCPGDIANPGSGTAAHGTDAVRQPRGR